MSDQSRLTQLDAMRGLACLAVCWFHLTNGYGAYSLVRYSGSYGWLGVEVFFVISGFIIPYALQRGGYRLASGWRLFLGKRILRIEPPYLFAVVLAFSLWQVSSLMPGFQGEKPPPVFSAPVLFHLGYLNAFAGYSWLNPVFWTLAIEFQFYLLVSLLFGIISHSDKKILIGSNIFLAALSIFVPYDFLVFRYLGLFLIGISVFQFRAGLIDKLTFCALVLVVTVAVWFSQGADKACVALLAGVLTVVDFKLNNIKFKPVLALGTISYSLHLTHVPIGGRVVNYGKRYIETQTQELVLSLIGLVISVIFAGIFYRIIEKPVQVLSSNIRYKSRTNI